jgi:diaminohydroxyphosphoribosylaminopyrimidine deaminase / 5-amino-6-(5-phosphoribosylamino)uracil reductase
MSNIEYKQSFSQQDAEYIAKAISLAKQGLYTTSPNPRVGCVIVKDMQVIGRGAHFKAGEPHAEVFALREAGTSSQGATAYVTLEPCSHHGKTPPCADALIDAGVKRVVVAMHDPNPLVAGQGVARLRVHGIQVDVGCLADEAADLNLGFIKRMTLGMPYVRAKIAASLDGKTALKNGESQWITGEAARLDVQHWRAQSCAIITGIGTVIADNPQMNVRLANTQRQPLRVIVDSHLRVPIDANILRDIDSQNPVLIAYADDKNQRVNLLKGTGASLLSLPMVDSDKVDLKALLATLAQQGVNEVLLEAGQGLNGGFMQAGLIDAYILYYAPKWMGQDARGMLGLPEYTNMLSLPALEIFDVSRIGQDVRILAKQLNAD